MEDDLILLHQLIGQGTTAAFIIMFPVNSVPTNFLKCNGAGLDTTTYKKLFDVIGYTFGGSGSTFNLPDLRGLFPRVLDEGKGYDVGRAIGSYQADGYAQHTHTYNDAIGNHYMTAEMPYGSDSSLPGSDASVATINCNADGTETRPKNYSVIYCIKY